MSSPELIRLDEDALLATTPIGKFVNEWSAEKHCAFVVSAFRRLRSKLKGAAENRGIRVLEAADGGDTSKNWLRLGQVIQDLTTALKNPVIVLLDEPKALFEGGDRMSQGVQIAIEKLQRSGWACSWFALRDSQDAPLPQAYQRMSEWLTRGVPLSRELLAFCALDHRVSPDEHALDAMGSKGDWKNRFGRVRLTASRAILASIREVLDDTDIGNSALVAVSIRADGFEPQKLAPDESGWGYRDFDQGWCQARVTQAALVWLRTQGRLPTSARARIDAMLSSSNGLAILVGLRTGNRIGFGKACDGIRRYEELLRSCRNMLEHCKDAPRGSYQLIGSILTAAEDWEASVRTTLASDVQFPDDWPGWNHWSCSSIRSALQLLPKPSVPGGIIPALALVAEKNIYQIMSGFQKIGGGLAQISKDKSRFIRLAKDCSAMAEKIARSNSKSA